MFSHPHCSTNLLPKWIIWLVYGVSFRSSIPFHDLSFFKFLDFKDSKSRIEEGTIVYFLFIFALTLLNKPPLKPRFSEKMLSIAIYIRKPHSNFVAWNTGSSWPQRLLCDPEIHVQLSIWQVPNFWKVFGGDTWNKKWWS